MTTLYSTNYDPVTGKTTNTQTESPVNFDVTSPVDANNLNNTQGPVLPNTNNQMTFAGDAKANAGIPSAYPEPETPTEPATPQTNWYKTQVDKLSKLFGAEGTQSKIGLEETEGVNRNQEDLNKLAAQMKTVELESQAAEQELESQSGGKDVTSTFLGRQQQEVRRQSSIRSNTLAAQYLVKQGDLTNAKARVDRALSAQYGVDIANLDRYIQTLELNKPLMTAEEQKVADFKSAEAQKKKDELKTIEDFKKTVWEKLIDAGDLTNAAKVLQETDASKISGYISALPQTEKPNIFGSADGGYYEQYYDTASKSWKVKSVIGPSTPNGAQASTGFSDLETEQDARAEISKQLQLNKTPQEAFNIVRLLFSRNEVSDSALEELTGVAEQKRQEEVKKNQKMVQNLPISKGSTSKNGASRTTAQPLVSSLSYKAPSLDDFNDVTKGIASFFNF